MARTAYVNIAEARTKDYEARVVREKASLLEFLLNNAVGRYVLEVLNKESGRLKRKKIGYVGIVEVDKCTSLLYFNNIESILFEENKIFVSIKKCYVSKESEGSSPIFYDNNKTYEMVLGDF